MKKENDEKKKVDYTQIIVAIIAALATIAGAYWQFVGRAPRDPPVPQQIVYTGQVLDSRSGNPIRGAEVTLDAQGTPAVVSTDSEGGYNLVVPTNGDLIAGRITVQAAGYERFDRNVTLSSDTAADDIHLNPLDLSEVPTPEASQEQTSSAAEELGIDWPVVYRDDFSTDQGVWYVGEYTDQFGTAIRTVDNRRYYWEIVPTQEVTDQFVWLPAQGAETGTDFFLTTRARQVGGVTGAYGLIFRLQDAQNYYFFHVSDTYEFALHARVGGKERVLAHGTSSEIIPGADNELAVIGEGSRLTLFINRVQVAEVDDGSLSSGQMGLGTTTFETIDRAFFEFLYFELRAPG